MAAFGRGKTLWTYVTDNAENVPFKALTDYTTQSAVLGGEAYSGSDSRGLPPGLKPRAFIVKTAGGVRRRVVVYDNTKFQAGIINTTSVNIDVASVATAATLKRKEGERARG